MTILISLILLAVLIFVHELGHFISAKLCGVRVDAFAIGFGPKIFKKKIGEVVYSLNLIPFGGYVKIFGENPDDESINGIDKDRSFVNKNKLQQIFILSAGVLFNFIFAWILVSMSFMNGVPAGIDSYEKYANKISDQRIIITHISDNSPAQKAGLIAGDRLVIGSTDEIINKISNSEGKEVEIKYIRDSKESTVKVIPEKGMSGDKYAIGIAMENIGILKLPFFTSIYEGFIYTVSTIKTIFVELAKLIAGIFTGSSSMENIAGPVGIVGMIGDATRIGFTNLIMFAAVISINLGVLNLIPFPALDGGRIFFVIIEAIIRKPIKPNIANVFNAIGFAILMLLIVVVTFKDITKLFN